MYGPEAARIIHKPRPQSSQDFAENEIFGVLT